VCEYPNGKKEWKRRKRRRKQKRLKRKTEREVSSSENCTTK